MFDLSHYNISDSAAVYELKSLELQSLPKQIFVKRENLKLKEPSKEIENEVKMYTILKDHNIQHIAPTFYGQIEKGLVIEVALGSLGNLSYQMAETSKHEYLLSFVKRLSTCLNLLHGLGIVHRDIKPDNILYFKDYRLVLCDFGFSFEELCMGSPYWMAPENHRNIMTKESDIWSLGLSLLYFCFNDTIIMNGIGQCSSILKEDSNFPDNELKNVLFDDVIKRTRDSVIAIDAIWDMLHFDPMKRKLLM